MGWGQDNPAGLSSPAGGKINQPGYVAPPGVKITRGRGVGYSYCSRIMGGGQDNPAGLSSPLGGKINQPGYVAPPPRGEDNQGGG